MSERPSIDLEVQLRLWATDIGDRITPFAAVSVPRALAPVHAETTKRRRRIVAAAAAAVVVVAVGIVAWRTTRDDEGATIVVNDDSSFDTTLPPPPGSPDPIDAEAEFRAKVQAQIAAAGLQDVATITSSGDMLSVTVEGYGEYFAVARIDLGLWMSATAANGDPVASYRNCVRATGDPDAAPCADVKAASDPDLSGRVWLGDEQIRAIPLWRLDALDAPPTAYWTTHIITAAQAADPDTIAQLVACEAATQEANDQMARHIEVGRPIDPPPRPAACNIPGVIG